MKTLSNFHSPELLKVGEGMLRKRKVDGRREQHQTEVSCPAQNKTYSETFHLIDKGNGAEANYDMGGHSKGHNWSPKLTMRYFNMNLNNGSCVYKNLMKENAPFSRALSMPSQVKELAHALMQRGEPMRRYKPEHPKHVRDLTHPFDYGCGRRLRSDAKGDTAPPGPMPRAPPKTINTLKKKQKKSTWRQHQSKAHTIQNMGSVVG